MDGDFYDLVQDRSGRLVVSVGEVSGQGIAEAILMSGIQALLRGLSRASTGDILGVVRDLNRTVYEVSPDDFFSSLFYARLDAGSRQLQYVSAGAEPALLIHGDGTVHHLDSTGAVLGLTARANFTCRTVAFEPGDLLIAFSDGIPDAAIPAVIQSHPQAGASQIVSLIMESAASIADPVDDYTVVAVRNEQSERARLSRGLKAWYAGEPCGAPAA